MQHILVTGVAGFIGHKTAEILLSRNYKVTGLDNLNDYYNPSIKLKRLDSLKNLNFNKIDILDNDAISKLFNNNKFDAVIHLAAMAGVPNSILDPKLYLNVNSNGTLNILDAMVKNSCNKIVMASTSSLYAGKEVPFIESVPTDSPISPYAASKKSAEVMAYTYHKLYNLDVSIVRYFTVYGPMGRPDMCIYKFIDAIKNNKPIDIYGDGTQSRDFTYVDDIAYGNIKALKNVGYEIFNLGAGNNPINLIQVIEYIEKYLNKKAIINFKPAQNTDIFETKADISKARKIIDWIPHWFFEDGLLRTINSHI